MASLEYYRSEGMRDRRAGYAKCDHPSRLTYDEADWWRAGWDQEDARQKAMVTYLLNCGTCKHATKITLDASKCPAGDPYPIVYACSKQNDHWMPDKCWTWIVGCASHSRLKFWE